MHTLDVVTTIGAVAPDEWDSLCGDRAFTQHRWLRLAETVLADHEPRYLLVRRDGRLVAAAVGTLQRQLQNATLDARFGWLVRRSPFLHVAISMTATPGLIVDDGPDRVAELGVLLQEIRAFVKRRRIPFCMIDHLPAEHPTLTAQRGFRQLAWLPDTRLDLTWASLDEYLADLPRKKRQEIGRMRRRAQREGIIVQPVTPTAKHSATLDRLVAAVVRRHGGTRHHSPDLFVKAATALGNDLTVLAARRHGSIVGCVALLRSHDDVAVRWIGRDYERTGDTAAYHALVTACVAEAITAGAHRLHLGGAAYETKKQFGVSLEPRSRLFSARLGAVNWLMGKLSHHFDPPQFRPG